jgi:hypothetical protein
MKVDVGLFFLIAFVVVLSAGAIYFVAPGPDIYIHYLTAQAMVKDPSMLWRDNLSGWESHLSLDTNIYTSYPPLEYIMYGVLLILHMPLYLTTILSIIAIGYFLYKIDSRAIPFLFLSFMFIRETVFNGNDIILVALALATFYFFIKKNYIMSGIFAGLAPLMKVTGFFVIVAWIVSIIYFERKNIFSKKIIAAALIMLLIPAPWYIRNLMLYQNIYLAVIGVSAKTYATSVAFLNNTYQSTQPERKIIDTSGYYPLPIDLLFYVGIAFFILNLIKKKKIEPYSFFIIIMIGVYFITQFLGIQSFVIRHEMIIFPFLALEIAKGIPEKRILYAILIAFMFLALFLFFIPKYAYNNYIGPFGKPVKEDCAQIKNITNNQAIYVNAFQEFFIAYQCQFNITFPQNQSVWSLYYDTGALVPTNAIGNMTIPGNTS